MSSTSSAAGATFINPPRVMSPVDSAGATSTIASSSSSISVSISSSSKQDIKAAGAFCFGRRTIKPFSAVPPFSKVMCSAALSFSTFARNNFSKLSLFSLISAMTRNADIISVSSSSSTSVSLKSKRDIRLSLTFNPLRNAITSAASSGSLLDNFFFSSFSSSSKLVFILSKFLSSFRRTSLPVSCAPFQGTIFSYLLSIIISAPVHGRETPTTEVASTFHIQEYLYL